MQRSIPSAALLLLSVLSLPALADPERIAVLELDRSAATSTERLFFSDHLRGAIGDRAKGYFVMTRESTDALLSAYGTTAAECEGECEVETGRKLLADYVVSGRLARVGSRLTLAVRMHATKDGRLVASAELVARDTDSLVDTIDLAADKLVIPLLPTEEQEPRRQLYDARMVVAAAAASGRPAPPEALAVIQRLERGPRLSRAWGFAGAGLAAAALGVGGLFGLKASSTKDEFVAGAHLQARADELQSQYHSQAATANILFAAGAALTVGTVLYFVLR